MKKNNKKLWTLILTLFMGASFVFAQSKQELKEQKAKSLKENIDSGNYKVDVNMAFPRRGKSISLTSGYSIEVKNDSVFSYLPYYGRAYAIPYGGGDGLRFSAPIGEYSVSYNNKGRARINITARTNEDLFKFVVDIYPGGSSGIDVNMQNRESIRFSGVLDERGERQ